MYANLCPGMWLGRRLWCWLMGSEDHSAIHGSSALQQSLWLHSGHGDRLSCDAHRTLRTHHGGWKGRVGQIKLWHQWYGSGTNAKLCSLTHSFMLKYVPAWRHIHTHLSHRHRRVKVKQGAEKYPVLTHILTILSRTTCLASSNCSPIIL